MTETKTQPHNENAERSVLGSVLIKPAAFPLVASLLETDDFFFPVNREIFDAMAAIHSRRMPIDVISLEDELQRRGQLSRLDGGTSFLLTLGNVVPTAENVEYYARLVREKKGLRQLIASCAEISSAAHGDFGELQSFLSDAVGKVSKVALRDVAIKRRGLPDIFDAVIDRMERAARGEAINVVPTGMEKLDRLLGGGLFPGFFIVPMGTTSSGKSSWGFQVVFRAAHRHRIPGLIFSLEMTDMQAFIKGAASIARIDTDDFKPRPKEQADYAAFRRAYDAGSQAARLGDLIRIEEARTIGEIVAISTAWRAEHPEGPAVILVDHIQKVRGRRAKGEKRHEEVAGVAQDLKDLAKDLGVPVIAPSQLDNDAVKENRAPKIGDSRDSKAIEHEADVLLGISRDRTQLRGEAQLNALKNRDGKVGYCTMMWMGPWQSFEDMDPELGLGDGEDHQ